MSTVVIPMAKVMQSACNKCADCTAPAEAVYISHVKPLLKRLEKTKELRTALEELVEEANRIDNLSFGPRFVDDNILKKARAALARKKGDI